MYNIIKKFLLILILCFVFMMNSIYTFSYDIYVGDKILYEDEVMDYDGDTYVDVIAFISRLNGAYKLLDINKQHLHLLCFLDEYNTVALNAELGKQYVNANGRYLWVNNSVIVEDDNYYLPLRVLSKIFNCRLNIDDSLNKIIIEIGNSVIRLGSDYYNNDTVELLAHLIYAEGGNQPLKGKIAIGNVVVNRVLSNSFPNNVREVVYANNQFDGVKSSNFYKQPNLECYIAAKIALEYYQVVDGALYFNRAGMDSWAKKTKTYVCTVGDHDFFK